MFIWTLSDAIGLFLIVVLSIPYMVFGLSTFIKQRFCKHDGTFGETSQCHAICHKCGKDLGFIGTWRDKQQKETK